MKHDYKGRQKRAFELIKGSAVLFLPPPPNPHSIVKSQAQEANINYLCGFPEGHCALLLVNVEKPRCILFLQDKDPVAELWEGRRTGVANAAAEYPVDESYNISDLRKMLPTLIKGCESLYYAAGMDLDLDSEITQVRKEERLARGRFSYSWLLPLKDIQMISNQLRLVKEPSEIECMKKAAAVTALAFDKIMRETRPGMNERQVHGMLIGTFMTEGADGEAYGSIVAGGNNACCLHYGKNDEILKDGELLLVDAGSRFGGYASDVTRCFPIGSQMSSAQKDIYTAVLGVQKKSIEFAKDGLSFIAIHDYTIRNMSEALLELGLVKGSVDEVIESKSYFKYFPHNTGHYLGLDVHDVGDYYLNDQGKAMEEGTVITIEPGIYVPASDETAPKEMRGVGVRIEDDIWIRKGGCEVLTAAIVKEIDQIEELKS
jgi:Xaa-Pro aminopeptidase